MSSTRPVPSSRNPKAKKAASTPEAQENRRAQLAAERLAAAVKARNRKIAIIGASILALVLLVTAAIWGITSASRQAKVTSTPLGAVGETGVNLFPGKAKAGAPKVVMYTDFQCPVCKTVEDGIGDEAYRLASNGDIDLEARTLTFLEEHPAIHNDSSTKTAVAAACAGIDGVDKYAEAFQAIYSFQPVKEGDGYSDQTLRVDMPAKIGLTGAALDTYRACYDKQSTKGFVRAVDTAGRVSIPRDADGKNWGTPTYTVNGKKMQVFTLQDKQTQKWNAAGLMDLITKTAA